MQLNFENLNVLSLNDLSEQFLQYQQEVSSNKVKFSQVIKDNLLQQCEEVFNKNPQIQSFIWSQYTPYDHMTFVPNFNVQEFAFLSFIPEENEELTSYLTYHEINAGDFIIDNQSIKDNKYLTPEGKDACQKFIFSLYACRELLEIAFGESNAVFVTREGYKILSYFEHD